MLLEGNVHHGLDRMITADLFVKALSYVFKIPREPMTIGAVSEPIMSITIDQQLRQMDNETLPGWDWSPYKDVVHKDVVGLTIAAALLHLHRQLGRE